MCSHFHPSYLFHKLFSLCFSIPHFLPLHADCFALSFLRKNDNYGQCCTLALLFFYYLIFNELCLPNKIWTSTWLLVLITLACHLAHMYFDWLFPLEFSLFFVVLVLGKGGLFLDTPHCWPPEWCSLTSLLPLHCVAFLPGNGTARCHVLLIWYLKQWRMADVWRWFHEPQWVQQLSQP